MAFVFPSIRSTATKLALVLIGGSILAQILLRATSLSLFLRPGEVLGSFALWQPITFVLLENDPLGVLFGALIIWQMGGALEASWGKRRLLAFSLGITFIAGVLTVLVSLGIPSLQAFGFGGGMITAGDLWVAYGLAIGRRQTNFWGAPVTGNVLALIGVAFVVLNAVFHSVLAMVPAAIGLVLTYAYFRGASPRFLWLKFQSWRLQRQLRGRAKHLRVIGRDRNMPEDSDRYLH